MKVKLHQCEVEKLVNVKIDRNEISHVWCGTYSYR